MAEEQAYGLWLLVALNAALFILFAFSFTRPKTRRDWRSFGAFSAFIIALFTEMYGFPLTIYLLTPMLSNWFPGMDLLSHDSGHLWSDLMRWPWDPHLNPIHILSNIFLVWGFLVIATAWPVLHAAQHEHRLATTGPYAKRRHPQYFGFIVVMTGFLLQWPTLITLAMFPVLVYMYVRLARREEREAIHEFGDAYRDYMRSTPGFLAWRRARLVEAASASEPGVPRP